MRILALPFVPLALALGALFPLGQESGAEAPRAPVTVMLLRHAEALASSAEEPDPALAPEGERRARTLARLLGCAGVTHLFASEYRRAQATLAPLAESLGLVVEPVPADAPEEQVAALRALPPGSVAVVAGHSNTVPGLAAALGGEMVDLVDDPRWGPMLPHDAHDRIAQVILPAGSGAAAQTIELRYGD